MRDRKVVARVFGGLGNQLFIYAAARRLAAVNDAELVLDDVSGFRRDPYERCYKLDQFNVSCRTATAAERLEPFSRIRRNLKRRWNRRLPFESRHYVQQSGMDFDARLLDLRVEGSLYLEGYWQSEDYWRDIQDQIRAELQVREPSDMRNLNMARQIRACDSVALHFRFFDSAEEKGANNAPIGYYARAVEHVSLFAPDAHYFVFSDQPELARRRVPLKESQYTLVTHNNSDHAQDDLWLMAQCRHFVIANSTFSWWGAWLAHNANKRVIAPDVKIRDGKMAWGFARLIPREWLVL